jgi:hypothetical protein
MITRNPFNVSRAQRRNSSFTQWQLIALGATWLMIFALFAAQVVFA